MTASDLQYTSDSTNVPLSHKIVVDSTIDEYMANTCENETIKKFYLKQDIYEQKIWDRVYRAINRLNPSPRHIDLLLSALIPGYSEECFYMDEFGVDLRTAWEWVHNEEWETF